MNSKRFDRNFDKRKPQRSIRVNSQIRVTQVRLIDEKGQQAGIVSREDALAKANEAGLDLVEIVPASNPPVCRIIDFPKYKYEQDKRERQARKKLHATEQKEIRLSPVISEHDYNFKKDHVVKFLKSGHRVKVQVRFRGRQIVHSEKGRELLERMARELNEISTVERNPRMEGRQIDIIFRPL